METLCRVCGSPGSYDIFGKIPKFLNSARTDIWDQPISKMISDVTGLPIAKNDGLPARVCGLCISYLKHAVSFRNRVVQTRLSLLSAAFITMKDPDENVGIVPEIIAPRMVSAANATKEKTVKIDDVKSVADNEMPMQHSAKIQRFFDYEEKTFVEDDMTVFDGLGIEINHPEVFRERKCGFCLKKFMLEETYDDHLDECLFRTLIEFIKDSNYIVRLKDDTAISNHEFIRRMVFAIQRVHKAIQGMQLPASATLVEEITADYSNTRRSETPPGRPGQQQTQSAVAVVPKVLHFFQQTMMRKSSPGPMGPPPNYNGNNNNNFFRSPRIQDNGNQHQTFFPQNNTSMVRRSPHQTQRSYNYNKLANSASSSSRGSGFQTPSPTAKNAAGKRGVVCKYCDKTFLTITHLDGHMIKEHT